MNTRLAFAWILVGCGGASRPAITEPTARLEVELRPNADRTAFLVPVVVNHQPFLFQVDTGASNSTITVAACTKARATCGDGSTAAIGAGGETSVPTTNVELQLGHRRTPIELAVMDMPSAGNPPADGVLGRDVFGDSVLELNFTRGQLVLGGAAAPGGVPFTSLLDSLIEMPATLDGAPIRAVVDVGASHSILNPLAAAKLHAPKQTSGNAAALGADGKPTAVTSVVGQSLAIEKRSIDKPALFVADLPVFATFGLDAKPAMILGLDILAHGRVVIDYGKHTIAISAQ